MSPNDPSKLRLKVENVQISHMQAENTCFVAPNTFTNGGRNFVVETDAKILLSVRTDSSVPKGCIWMPLSQRKRIKCEERGPTSVPPSQKKMSLKNAERGSTSAEMKKGKELSVLVTLVQVEEEINHVHFKLGLQKDSKECVEFNGDDLQSYLVALFENRLFEHDETLAVNVKDTDGKEHALSLRVHSFGSSVSDIRHGVFKGKKITFENETPIELIGKGTWRPGCNPEPANRTDYCVIKSTIGGLDKEIEDLVRRAYNSRKLHPVFIEKFGIKHVRGILLFGPPGTGKTLMARQLSKMLNGREPKIVNGPQILNKFVGESEANIRNLFADAEEEQRRCGANSGVHIIIFDEIDAICKQRGSDGASSVNDTVLTQLLSKMDGVDQLNNILVIATTNRRDLLDEALLRCGRFDVQLEINLPDKAGRLQILKIHTSRLRNNDTLDANVDLDVLAKKTDQFSGADIEGLVRDAQTSAMFRLEKQGVELTDLDALEQLRVNIDDFDYALDKNKKPEFGEKLSCYSKYGIIKWSREFSNVLGKGKEVAAKARVSTHGVKFCLTGPSKSGKSAIAAEIAIISGFSAAKVISCGEMVGYSESDKCQMIATAFDEALRSPLSVVFLDDIERLVGYCPVGHRFSNLVLQTIVDSIMQEPREGHRLLVLATATSSSFLADFGLEDIFTDTLVVPLLTKSDHVMAVVVGCKLVSLSQTEVKEMPSQIDQIIQDSPRGGIAIKRLIDVCAGAATCAEGSQAARIVDKMQEILQVPRVPN